MDRSETFTNTYQALIFARLQLPADEEPAMIAQVEAAIECAGKRISPEQRARVAAAAAVFNTLLRGTPEGRLPPGLVVDVGGVVASGGTPLPRDGGRREAVERVVETLRASGMMVDAVVDNDAPESPREPASIESIDPNDTSHASCAARGCQRRPRDNEDGWVHVAEEGRPCFLLCPADARGVMGLARALVAPTRGMAS